MQPAATSVRRSVRNTLFKIPGAQRAIVKLLAKPDFKGWGMECHTRTPWRGGRAFADIHNRLSGLVSSGQFNLTSMATNRRATALEVLRWRHHNVWWTSTYATRGEGALVECGVCDGVTAFFALSSTNRKAYLYDAWGPMKPELLLDSEMESVGRYRGLELDHTKRNLLPFADRCVFNKGYIPEVFSTADNPKRVAWLHIDLNSAGPTVAALDFFYQHMAERGVILFDDYGHHGFEDTMAAVNEWASRKPGMLLPLPTGQAVYFMS